MERNYESDIDGLPADLQGAYLEFLRQTHARERAEKEEARDQALDQLIAAALETSQRRRLDLEPMIERFGQGLGEKSRRKRRVAEMGLEAIIDFLAEEDEEFEDLANGYEDCWTELWDTVSLNRREFVLAKDKTRSPLALEAHLLARELKCKLLAIFY